MPALPAIAKAVRLDLHFSHGTDPNIQIREFFTYSGALSVTDATTWLGNIVTGWAAHMPAVQSNTSTLVLSVLTDLTSNTAPQIQNATAVAGTRAQASLPNGTAFLMKKLISRRYRGGHPRVYLGNMTVDLLSSPSLWDATAAGTITGDYLAFIAACTANTNPAAIGTITHVNISYYSGFTNHTYPSGRVKPIPTPRVTPLIDTVTDMVPVLTVASQRRRNETP
jgi:hypothetical protein